MKVANGKTADWVSSVRITNSKNLLYRQQLHHAFGEGHAENGRSSLSNGSSGSPPPSALAGSSSQSASQAKLVNGSKIPSNEELVEVQKELRNLKRETSERLRLLKKYGLEDEQDPKALANSSSGKIRFGKGQTRDKGEDGTTVVKKSSSVNLKKRKMNTLDLDDDSMSERGSVKDEATNKPSIGKIKIGSKLKDRSFQSGAGSSQHATIHALKADDFTLPQRYTLPVKPAPMPIMASPLENDKVDEDFTKIKAPSNQVPISTFYASIEPYFRPLTQEDVSWLEDRGDEISPFLIPPLGPYYLDTWLEEDRALAGLPPILDVSVDGPNGRAHELDPPNGVTDTSMTESDLVTEEKFAGPLSERILAALMTEKVIGPADVLSSQMTKLKESNEDGRGGWVGLSLGLARPNFEGMDLVEYEERIKRELQFLGLLSTSEDDVDWSNRCDDEISSLLRHCQDLLRTQIAENQFRRARLAEAAKDRMAYQDYQGVVDELDRGVELGFVQRLKAVKKGRKKERKEKQKENKEEGDGGIPLLAPTAADTNSIPISPALLDTVERRQRFIDTLAPVFAESDQVLPNEGQVPEEHSDDGEDDDSETKRMTSPPIEPSPVGRFTGTPLYTIYGGLDDWVRTKLEGEQVVVQD